MNIDLDSLVQFGDDEGLQAFIGDHAFAHETIAGAITDQTQASIQHFPLADMGNQETWMQVHDTEHRSIASALGLGDTPDLASYNLQDQQQFYDWMEYHASLHQIINATLGL